MKKNLLLILVLIFIASQGWTQSVNLMKADKLFSQMAYSSAVEFYEKELRKNKDDSYLLRQLAYSYDKMGKYQESLFYFDRYINTDSVSADDYYLYAKLLLIDERPVVALQWLEKYLELVPKDQRALSQFEQFISEEEEMTLDIVDEVETVAFNTRNTDMAVAFSPDGVIIASSSDTSGIFTQTYGWNDQPYLDLYEITQNIDGVQYDKLSKKINSRFHEGPVSYSSDYNKMWFTRNSKVRKGLRQDVINIKIFYTERKGKGWARAREFPYNSDEYSVGHPALSHDGKYLYYVSNSEEGFGSTDIYRVQLFENDSLGTPENLGSQINTVGREMFPFVDDRGVLYFSSDGLAGFGSLDIFAAFEVADSFRVMNLGRPINSSYDDFSFITNRAISEGYFTSNRPGGVGDDDIYHFDLKLPQLKIRIVDERTMEPLMASIELEDESGELKIIKSDINGELLADIHLNSGYRIRAEANRYFQKEVELKAFEYSKLENGELTISLFPEYNMVATIVNKENNRPISNVKVDILINDVDALSIHTDDNGMFEQYFPVNSEVLLTYIKDGYLPLIQNYNILNSDTIIEIEEQLDPVYRGKTFVLDNLYYDVNSSLIRSDAEMVLDELAEVLISNKGMTIELSSHTDSQGNDEYNEWLSQRRAQSAVNYLISKGIASNRLVPKGYGEKKLLNRCVNGVECSDEEHQVNRRTEIKILSF